MRLPAYEEEDTLQMTSMIDVVFLLLIFFLVATRLDDEAEREKLISVNLAEVLQAQPLAVGGKEILVNITREGQFVVAGEECSEAKLTALLQEASVRNPGNQRVQIRADQDVLYKFPLTVMGICNLHQIEYSCTVLQRGDVAMSGP